ncbi:MAG: TVP38/TMEM64 family protein [Christensenellales bacterium]|jgi:integral membrane protein
MAEWSNKLYTEKKALITKIIMAFIGIANLTLTTMFLQHLSALLFYCAVCIFSAVFIALLLLKNVTSSIYKLLMLINAAALIVVAVYIIFYETGTLDKITNTDELREFVKKSGSWGIVVLFMLTLLQVVVLPIPSAVTILLGVFLYGPTVSFIVSTVGTVVGSILCFIIGKFFGYKVVAWIIGDEKAKKYSELLREKGKIPFIVMMLFPFFPDDILCMVAGLTKMTFKFFIISICLTRPIMIAFFSYFGTGEIIPFKGWGIPVWIGLFALAVFLLYLINYLLNKKKNKNK